MLVSIQDSYRIKSVSWKHVEKENHSTIVGIIISITNTTSRNQICTSLHHLRPWYMNIFKKIVIWVFMVLALSVTILFTCFYPKGKVCKICIITVLCLFWYLIQTFVMLVIHITAHCNKGGHWWYISISGCSLMLRPISPKTKQNKKVKPPTSTTVQRSIWSFHH